jgi:hypothetical protein
VAIWRVKRVLDEYKRLIKEHDVARLDQHRYVCVDVCVCVEGAGWGV